MVGNAATKGARRAADWLGRVRAAILPTSAGLESSRYLAKWLLIGATIGLIAGLGAVVFLRALDFATHVLLGDIVGYVPPGPVGEGQPILQPMMRPRYLPVVAALGGLLSLAALAGQLRRIDVSAAANGEVAAGSLRRPAGGDLGGANDDDPSVVVDRAGQPRRQGEGDSQPV